MAKKPTPLSQRKSPSQLSVKVSPEMLLAIQDYCIEKDISITALVKGAISRKIGFKERVRQ